MFELAVQAKVHRYRQEEFLQTLRSLQSDEEGNMGSTDLALFKDGINQATYRLRTRWETEEELEKYLSGDRFKILIGALQVLCDESAVRYRHIPENLIHHLKPILDAAECGSLTG